MSRTEKAIVLQMMLDAAHHAKRTIKVCVPSSGDFYRRHDEWQEETYEVIDAEALIQYLEEELEP